MACRARLPKRVLHRFVLDGDVVVADPLQRLPGRGSYVCSAACLQEAVRRHAFARAYRRPVRADPGLGTPAPDPDTRLED